LHSDGKIVWAAGPEGLARLRSGKWERFLPETGITALAAGPAGTVWVGTSGAGVLRINKSGDKLEHFAAAQGCDLDVIRGMVAAHKPLLVVGEGAGGPRAAFFAGERFHSYTLEAPAVIEWAARAGSRLMVGAGDHLYAVVPAPPPPPPGAKSSKGGAA